MKNLFKRKAQPKSEHPTTFPQIPLQGPYAVCERCANWKEQVPNLAEPVYEKTQGHQCPWILKSGLHPLLNRPLNPALEIVISKNPRPRVDPDLIGTEYR